MTFIAHPAIYGGPNRLIGGRSDPAVVPGGAIPSRCSQGLLVTVLARIAVNALGLSLIGLVLAGRARVLSGILGASWALIAFGALARGILDGTLQAEVAVGASHAGRLERHRLVAPFLAILRARAALGTHLPCLAVVVWRSRGD